MQIYWKLILSNEIINQISILLVRNKFSFERIACKKPRRLLISPTIKLFYAIEFPLLNFYLLESCTRDEDIVDEERVYLTWWLAINSGKVFEALASSDLSRER